jgi:hypothetical protein
MDETALGRFGDKRREDVGAVLLSAVQSKRTLCIHRLAENRNQTLRFNNFLANPAASTHEMLVTAGQKTNRRATGRHVLAVMDTTDVLFPTQEANKRGFGLGSDGAHPGLFLHPVLAVDAASGGVIGLVDCIVLDRTEGRVSEAKTSTQKKIKTHKKRTADDKESRRWLQATEMAGDALTDADMITMVGDREGDIYHLFAHRSANVHLLVRSAQPRTLATGGLLPDYCAALPEQARETIDVPAKGKQPARKATVAMRYGPVNLNRPAQSPDKDQPETVSLWVVDLQEIDPPEGTEPVRWRLLTKHTPTTLEQARQIVAGYRMRWIHRAGVPFDEIGLFADRGFADGGCQRLHQTRRRGPDRGARGRLVRPHLPRIPAAGTQDHTSRIAPARPHPGWLAIGESFRGCATPLGQSRGHAAPTLTMGGRTTRAAWARPVLG